MSVPTIPIPSTLALSDKVINQVNTKLLTGLKLPHDENTTWLSHAFGRAETIFDKKDNSRHKFPAVYSGEGDKEYLSLSPNDKYGNFSFFIMEDEEQVTFGRANVNELERDFSIVFWLNLQSILQPSEYRNRELIKEQVFKLLKSMVLPGGRITIESSTESKEGIYREYNLTKKDYGYLMHPYTAIRFNGKMKFREECA